MQKLQIFSALCAVILLTSCAQQNPPADQTAATPNAASTAPASADIPVPLYPGATAEGEATHSAANEQHGASRHLKTRVEPSPKVEDVATFYWKELEKLGWTVGNTNTKSDGVEILAKKGNEDLVVSVDQQPGDYTNITIHISEAKTATPQPVSPQ